MQVIAPACADGVMLSSVRFVTERAPMTNKSDRILELELEVWYDDYDEEKSP